MREVGKGLKMHRGNVCHIWRTVLSSQPQLQDPASSLFLLVKHSPETQLDRVAGSFSRRWKGEMGKRLEDNFCRLNMGFTEEHGCLFPVAGGLNKQQKQITAPAVPSARSCSHKSLPLWQLSSMPSSTEPLQWLTINHCTLQLVFYSPLTKAVQVCSTCESGIYWFTFGSWFEQQALLFVNAWG